MQRALNALEATEVPVIGALHGQAMGLGLELALAFDLRVASEDCQLSIPEARVGLVADVGGTTRLARTIGPSRAKDMLLTARGDRRQEALGWGLVNRVVPAAELLPAAIALAGDIMKNAPLAVGLAKLIVDQGDGLPKLTPDGDRALGPEPVDHDRRRGRSISGVHRKASAEIPRKLTRASASQMRNSWPSIIQ